MSGITTATVLAGIGAAATVGSTIKSITSKPSSPKKAPTPVVDTGPANVDPAVAEQAAVAPGRAANIASGATDSSTSLASDEQYSVKKKLLGD